jgi:hypothetical protein
MMKLIGREVGPAPFAKPRYEAAYETNNTGKRLMRETWSIGASPFRE